MNSDRFDRVVMDLLYGELDELTTAAARRHMDQSARARDIYCHLAATRKLSALPSHAPPDGFAVAVARREREVLSRLPLHQRTGRLVSKLAGYAMRPQLSMGALLLLMIGSSLMFLRARPGQHGAMQVTGRGVPEADVERVIPVSKPTPLATGQAHGVFELRRAPAKRRRSDDADPERKPLAPAAAAVEPAPRSDEAAPRVSGDGPTDEGLDPFDQAVQLYRGGQYVEAERRFERLSRTGGSRAAEAALYSAQATRNASGCGPAVSRFERVRLRFPGTGPAYEAAWRAAKCLYQLGDVEAARQNYESLLQVGSHSRRARRALEALGSVPRAEPRGAAEQLLRPRPRKQLDDAPAAVAGETAVDAQPSSPTAADAGVR